MRRTRTRYSWFSGAPYTCTLAFSKPRVCMVSRTSLAVMSLLNFTWMEVPPAKSTPRFRPRTKSSTALTRIAATLIPMAR